MTWASVESLGSAQEKVSDTAITLSIAGAPKGAVGDVFVVAVAFDNIATADGETADVTVTDDRGNSYVRAKEFQNGNGAAGAGAGVAIFYSILTTGAVNTITATFGSAVTAKAMSGRHFTKTDPDASLAGSTAQADDAVDPSAITLSGLASQQYLWVHTLAGEGPDTDAYTWDADYSQFGGIGTTGGADDTNMHIRSGFRIFTGIGDTVDVTSDTADRDYAQVFVALREGLGAAPQPADVPFMLGLVS